MLSEERRVLKEYISDSRPEDVLDMVHMLIIQQVVNGRPLVEVEFFDDARTRDAVYNNIAGSRGPLTRVATADILEQRLLKGASLVH
jgi:hypothetical protein